MIKSLMANTVTEKDFSYLISSYDVTAGVNVFNYFPLKKQIGSQWKSGTNSQEDKKAAPVISRNASIPLGEEPTTEVLRGDIPKIAVKYEMKDDEITEFQAALALAGGDAAARQLVNETLDDHAQRVIRLINNRVTWIALQSMSRGKVELTRANNANGNIVSEQDMDYDMQKHGRYGDAWTSKTTATPISGDFVNAVKDGKGKGRIYKRVWMSADTFATMAATDEVIKLSASFATNLLGAAYIPSVEQVNTALRGRADLNGLQINIIDEILNVDGENKNPFINNVCLFTEGESLGQSHWFTPADMSVQSAAMKAMNSFICVKKWAEEDPLMELTAGIANIIPAFEASQRAMLLDVVNSSWNEGN